VANALLDYRMHCAGLTDEEALRFLTEDVYQSEGEAVGKIIRAKLSSCQLSTYFVGRMAFYRLRQAVERERGDRFDLGRYHEAVPAPGAVAGKAPAGAGAPPTKGPARPPAPHPPLSAEYQSQPTMPRLTSPTASKRSGSPSRRPRLFQDGQV